VHGFREDLVGLDITADCIIATRVRPVGDGRFEVRNAGWVSYPAGDSAARVARHIRRLWRRSGLANYTVCSCLRSRALMLRYFQYPGLAAEELASALRLQAEETLVMSGDEIVIDWHLNRHAAAGETADSPGGAEGVLVAVPKAEVDRHLAMLEQAGLVPVVVDVGCMALCNLFLALRADACAAGAVCLVNLATHTADVAVLLKQGWIYPHVVFAQQAAWESSVEYLGANIADVLKYYRFKLRQEPVARLILTGHLPSGDGFAGQLGERVGLPVEIWDPLSGLELGTRRVRRLLERHPGAGPLLATSLGLAMRRS